MMLRTGVVGAVVLLFAAGEALAQTGTITGAVTSTEGRPLEGAQVRVVGATAGSISREDGRYTIAAVPSGTYTVRVSRIGYAADSTAGVVVTAGAPTTVNFSLRPTATVLTGVVVVGYGRQEARDVTGVVASVDTTTFNKGRIVSPEQLIMGKVAGVQVVDNNEPGGGLAIRIRGGTSVNASNDPLYVVDGVPITVGGGASAGRNPLNFLNPNDIESITVLKDASSTAIYGSRGANGVVIITTKTGITGPQFTYSGSVSGSRVTGGPDLVNADQFRAAVTTYYPSNVASLGSANTDWLDAVTQDAGGIEHNLGFNGRREDLNYRLGVGYLDQKGVLQGTRTQRVAGSFNYSDRLLNDRFGLRAHIKGSRTKDWFTPGGVLGQAVAFAPTSPIRSGNTFYEYRNPTTQALVNLAPNNPLGDLAVIDDYGVTMRSIGNIEGEYQLPFISGLTATVRAGYDLVRANRTTFTPSTSTGQLKGNASTRGSLNRNSPEQQNTVLDAYATYQRDFDQYASNVDITAGYSTERFRGDYGSFNAAGLSTDLLGPNGVPTATESRPFYSIDESRLVSGFGRVNWSLLDRYLFTATVRRDGSSRFAEGNQYGTFPSAAIAWRVLDEPSLQGRLPLSDLKLRVSWGRNGNQSVGNYLAYTSYGFGQNTAQAQLGNAFVSTIRPSASDPNLQWEQTTSTNVGLDYGFANGRFSGTIDFYTKKTEDLLFRVPTAAGTALSNFITTNIGSVQNRGFELSLDARVLDGGSRGFSWNANLNASHNANELLTIDRPGINSIATGGVAGGVGTTIQVIQPGQPVNSFYVYEHKRVNGKPVASANDIDMYVDRDNNGIINSNDLRAYKDPAPKWIFGHTSNLGWRGFDASTTLRAYIGNYVYNNVASNFGHYSVLSSPFAPVNLHASVLDNEFVAAQYLSDVYVEEASFIRMDNLTLGYTFSGLRNVQDARIFGTIQNVFTTTKYSGVDPTAGVNGIDNNLYPRSRTFLAGLSVGF
jgi:iron complex outermembrane receptor protein